MAGMTETAILVEGLAKRFGEVVALDGIDFQVPAGTVFGLLGPNGAGKTTAVRVLATVLAPDGGRAEVLGHDVVREAEAVRHRIGLAGQNAAVDPNLTGRENLRLIGRLTQLGRRDIESRSAEILQRFGLADAADRPVRTYSGGMRRRLDVGAALVHRPPVLFLDEPTTGLDPEGRNELWDVIRELVADGTTVLLTTQYLEEADRLADKIVVIDRGEVVASGTATELKTKVGGERIDVVVRSLDQLGDVAAALRRAAGAEPSVEPDDRRVTVSAGGGAAALTAAVRELDAAGVVVEDIALRRPTLDDVFLQLTGHHAEESDQSDLAEVTR